MSPPWLQNAAAELASTTGLPRSTKGVTRIFGQARPAEAVSLQCSATGQNRTASGVRVVGECATGRDGCHHAHTLTHARALRRNLLFPLALASQVRRRCG